MIYMSPSETGKRYCVVVFENEMRFNSKLVQAPAMHTTCQSLLITEYSTYMSIERALPELYYVMLGSFRKSVCHL